MSVTFTIDSTTGLRELHATAAFIAAMGGRIGAILPALTDMCTGPFSESGEQFVTQESLGFDEDSIVTNLNRPEIVSGETVSAAATDSAGVEYDARVHAETRMLNKDGTWRKRRNAIETPPIPFVPAATESPAAVVTIAAEVAPPPPPPPPAPPAPPVGNKDEFMRFVDSCSAHSVPMTKIGEALVNVGLSVPNDLRTNLHHLPAVRFALGLEA